MLIASENPADVCLLDTGTWPDEAWTRQVAAELSCETAFRPPATGRDSLTGLQAFDRTGLVHTAIHGDRVYLTGRAVTVLDGTLNDFTLAARP